MSARASQRKGHRISPRGRAGPQQVEPRERPPEQRVVRRHDVAELQAVEKVAVRVVRHAVREPLRLFEQQVRGDGAAPVDAKLRVLVAELEAGLGNVLRLTGGVGDLARVDPADSPLVGIASPLESPMFFLFAGASLATGMVQPTPTTHSILARWKDGETVS